MLGKLEISRSFVTVGLRVTRPIHPPLFVTIMTQMLPYERQAVKYIQLMVMETFL